MIYAALGLKEFPNWDSITPFSVLCFADIAVARITVHVHAYSYIERFYRFSHLSVCCFSTI